MERIVVGYDGSPGAASALRWTAARAGRGATTVDVVFVASPFTRERAANSERLGEAEAMLLERCPGLQVQLHGVDGAATDSIVHAAEQSDLVVIGINPGHPIRTAAAGWTPLRLSARAAAPVCMVPVAWTEGDDPVTVGIADDDTSVPALDFGIAEAVATATGLRLVHSWLMPSPTFDYGTAITTDPDEVIEDHRELLNGAAQRVLRERPTLPVQSELIRDSRSAALLRFASRSSLLVIGTHHRGVLAGSLLGSVAQEVLWRAECPICVVPLVRAKSLDRDLMTTSPNAVNVGTD